MPLQPAVYILASGRNGTLYVRVTGDLVRRIWQHREHRVDGFTRRYGVDRLVWFEQHDSMESTIPPGETGQGMKRAWKVELIEKANAYWRDLWPDITGETQGAGFLPAQE